MKMEMDNRIQRMILFNKTYWKDRKQSKEHITKRINNTLKTFKEKRVKTSCNYCNHTISYTLYRFNLAKLHFCNKKCKGKYMEGNYKGFYSLKRNKKISKALKGKKFTKEHKEKISEKSKERLKDPTKNNNWRGGLSFELYGKDFNIHLKNKIRIRDNYTCQICKINQNKLNYKLHVHHIDSDKLNNNLSNLISLCRSCHIKTHHEKR